VDNMPRELYEVEAVFSSSAATEQLMYSYAAYCPSAKISAWNCGQWCSSVSGFVVTDVVSDSLTSTFAYIGYKGSVVEVVFRGSTDITNWILNLNVFTPISFPGVSGAKVHGGFWASYITVKDTLTAKVLALATARRATSIVFTGHSLGGALATLTAAQFYSRTTIPITVYTFGSPRVGNAAFSSFYNSVVPNTFRNTYKSDIVVHLPPTNMDFLHVTEEIWWRSGTTYKQCSLTGEDSSCANSIFAFLYSTGDHTSYLGIPLGTCT